MKKDSAIHVRLSEEHLAKIKTAADEQGIPISTYIRMVALRAAKQGDA